MKSVFYFSFRAIQNMKGINHLRNKGLISISRRYFQLLCLFFNRLIIFPRLQKKQQQMKKKMRKQTKRSLTILHLVQVPILFGVNPFRHFFWVSIHWGLVNLENHMNEFSCYPLFPKHHSMSINTNVHHPFQTAQNFIPCKGLD